MEPEAVVAARGGQQPSRLARNALYNASGQAALVVLNLVLVRVVFGGLGGDALGVLFASITLAALLSAALDLGASVTTVLQISAYSASDVAYVRRLVATASFVYWTGFVLLVVLVWLAAPYLATAWIRIESLDVSTAATTLAIFAVGALTVLPRSLYVSLLRGLQHMQVNNLVDVSVAAAQVLGTVAIVGGGGALPTVAAWFALCALAGLVAYVTISSRFVGWRALVPRVSIDVVRRNARFASRMLLVSVASTVHAQTDRIFVSKLAPLATFGFYSVAARLVSTAMLPAAAVVQAALPALSATLAAGDVAGALAKYRRLQTLICFGMVPVVAGVAFAGTPVFSFVLGPGAAELLFAPTVLLCLAYYLNVTMQIPYAYALACGRPGIAARWNLSALALLPVTGLLVLAFGLVGAALATILYQMWAYASMIRRICIECLRMRPLDWYAEIARIAVLGLATYGPALVLVRSFDPNDVLVVTGAYALASCAFVAGWYRVAAPEVRALLESARYTMLGAAGRPQ